MQATLNCIVLVYVYVCIYCNISCDNNTGIFLATDWCPSEYTYNPYSRTCIRRVAVKKTWTDAQNYCKVYQDFLITLTSLESFLWFANHLETNSGGIHFTYVVN